MNIQHKWNIQANVSKEYVLKNLKQKTHFIKKYTQNPLKKTVRVFLNTLNLVIQIEVSSS